MPNKRLDELTELARVAERMDRKAAKAGSARPERVPYPALPARGRLGPEHRWQSLLWSIDSAAQHGPDALRGLTIALSRVIQGECLDTLLFDARERASPRFDPKTPLWKPALALNAAGQTFADLRVRKKKAIKVKLEDAAVFPHPWERWRLHGALGNMGKKRPWGPFRQNDNHLAIGWWPWPVVMVGNGNHSTLAGQLRGGGTLTCEETYDLAPVLEAVRTDGLQWYREDDGSSLGPVTSMAMAGIFVIGQRLLDLGPTRAR
jgi:hypothetical protein